MPTVLQFDCTYTSREGHCPKVDGWTYHHILPVRYYWSAAFILVKLLRLKQCATQQSGGDLKAEFGTKNALDFFAEDFDILPKDVKEICMSLHQTPNGGARQQFMESLTADLSKNESIAAAVGPLTGPRYGGFAGMKGSDQRTDDPGSAPEKQKPYGFSVEQWTFLTEVRNALERCLGGIAGKVNGPYKCSLTVTDANSLLHHLRCLKDLSLAQPYPFTPTDWDIKVQGNSVAWYYVEDPPVGSVRLGNCARIFSLNSNGLGGSVLRPSEFPHVSASTNIVAKSVLDSQMLQWIRLP